MRLKRNETFDLFFYKTTKFKFAAKHIVTLWRYKDPVAGSRRNISCEDPLAPNVKLNDDGKILKTNKFKGISYSLPFIG